VRSIEDVVTRSALKPASKNLIMPRLLAKEEDFLAVLRDLGSTALVVAGDDVDVTPGQTFTVTARLWNRGRVPLENVNLALSLPDGWVAAATNPAIIAGVEHNQCAKATFKVTVSPTSAFTGPFDPAPVKAVADWQFAGAATRVSTASTAEVRVVPAVSVALNPAKVRVPYSDSATTRDVTVTLKNFLRTAAKGQVVLSVPEGWTVSGNPAYAMQAENEVLTVALKVTIPAKTAAGFYPVQAAATFDGGASSTSVQVIAYPHIDTKYHLYPAEGKVGVVDVKVAPGLKVGYVDSGFDNVPASLTQMGVDVTLLTPADLASADLSKYDTIVLGVRAYLSRPDLATYNFRLLEYVKNGGNLIVQYNKTNEIKSSQPPFPITISSNRVTVEEAPPTLLQPDHILFNAPNKIVAADWDGWIQERGLYFPKEWAPEYTPLVAFSDPGEQLPPGAWLIAGYGKGTYIYTALVWYRQLDGLVPGGYRMFANMLSLPKTTK
jgi:hypothetical protein